MTRVLFLGDIEATGFGTVTRDLATALVRRGEDVRLISMNEYADLLTDPDFPAELRERVIILGHSDGWLALGEMTPSGQRAREEVIERAKGVLTGTDGWKPDCLILMGDPASAEVSPWHEWLPPDMLALHYVPIEGIDLPPRWAELWNRMQPVAVTQSGADEIARLTGSRPPVVYHGVDTRHFHPVSNRTPIVMKRKDGVLLPLRSKAECRRFLGWPEDEIILFRADRHMPRKNYSALFRAVAPVLERHRNVRLLFHCRTMDEGGNLANDLSKYPTVNRRMNSTGFHALFGGVDRRVLCAMYNAADIYVSASAEGFGLTIAEALACGTPAIGLDYSAVPEVIGPAGVTVPVHLQDNIYSYYWASPQQAAYTEALEDLVTHERKRRILGLQGPAHVRKFSWAKAAEQFSALMAPPVRQELAA